MESSICETPERHASRRLSDHLTFEGQKQKVHSLVDKVYSRKNLKLAWERVRANRGASGADKVTIGDFEAKPCGQGCSTLFTEGHRKYGFETAESGGVAVLRDCVGLIEPENIVGEASNSREDARIFSNARCVFA